VLEDSDYYGRAVVDRPLSRADVPFSAAAVKSGWRAGTPWKIRLAAAIFSASLREHSNKRYHK